MKRPRQRKAPKATSGKANRPQVGMAGAQAAASGKRNDGHPVLTCTCRVCRRIRRKEEQQMAKSQND